MSTYTQEISNENFPKGGKRSGDRQEPFQTSQVKLKAWVQPKT